MEAEKEEKAEEAKEAKEKEIAANKTKAEAAKAKSA